MTNTIIYIIQIISVIIASSIHEFAHAIVADKLGDPTPRLNGRLTLNPFAHIDPIGAISLWLFKFGWSKPVPINPNNFKNKATGIAIVSLAGPSSNILISIIASLLLKIFPITYPFILPFILINCALALFNLIPIAPLDGYKIISSILPINLKLKWNEIERYGTILLLLLILPFSPLYPFFSIYMGKGLQLLVNLIIF